MAGKKSEEIELEIDEDKIQKEEQINKNKGVILNLFLLASPALFLAGMCILNGSMKVAIAAIVVFFYQAILLKNYIEKQQAY